MSRLRISYVKFTNQNKKKYDNPVLWVKGYNCLNYRDWVRISESKDWFLVKLYKLNLGKIFRKIYLYEFGKLRFEDFLFSVHIPIAQNKNGPFMKISIARHQETMEIGNFN